VAAVAGGSLTARQSAKGECRRSRDRAELVELGRLNHERFQKLLERWEGITDRLDGLLKKWESK